jgi:hypothetical protein
VSGGSSTVCMPALVTRWVSLGLDNTAGNPVSPDLAHNGFSDEISSQVNRIRWQTGPR